MSRPRVKIDELAVSQSEIDYLMDNNTAYQSTEVKSFTGYDLENGNNPSIATDQNGRAHASLSHYWLGVIPEDRRSVRRMGNGRVPGTVW